MNSTVVLCFESSNFEFEYARKVLSVTSSIVSTSGINPRVAADSSHSASTKNVKFTVRAASEERTPESVS